MVFSGVPEGLMWSLGPRGVLVAFLGSSGVPVRVLRIQSSDSIPNGALSILWEDSGHSRGPSEPSGSWRTQEGSREGPWGIAGV